MALIADVAAELVERIAGSTVLRWVPRWARWAIVAAIFGAALALPTPPDWLDLVVELAWASVVFGSTIGVVFAAYARKLGDEGKGSLGFLVFSLALYSVVALLLPSLAEPGNVSTLIRPSPGYLLGLGLTVVDGVWVWCDRALRGTRGEPWASWSLRASALGLGAFLSLALAFVAGAPFFMTRDPPAPDWWYPAWGAGFCTFAALVCAFQHKLRAD